MTSNQDNERFYCIICSSTFSYASNLSRHVSKQHPNEQTKTTLSNFYAKCGQGSENTGFKKSTNRICSLCPKTFTTRQALYRHVKGSHRDEASSISHAPHSNMKCGLCISENLLSSFNSINDLCDHMTKIHQLDAPIQTIDFSDKIDVEFWRSYVELQGGFRFCLARGTKRKSDCQIEYLQCNRSGNPYGPSSQRKKLKLTFTCTAFAKITTCAEDKISINFCLTHYGHDKVVNPLKSLPRPVYSEITDLIKNGCDSQTILQKMKESPCCLSPGNKTYLDYIIGQITAFDITLIKRNLNCNEAKGRRTVYDNQDDLSMPPSPYAFEEIADKFIDQQSDDSSLNDVTRKDSLVENKELFLEKMVNICKELLIKGYEESNTATYILAKMQEIKDACE